MTKNKLSCDCVNCVSELSEDDFIEYLQNKYDLGLVQSSAVFYKVKEYLE